MLALSLAMREGREDSRIVERCEEGDVRLRVAGLYVLEPLNTDMIFLIFGANLSSHHSFRRLGGELNDFLHDSELPQGLGLVEII